MTYEDQINTLSDAIKKQVGSIEIIMTPRSVKIKIDDVEWSREGDNVVIAAEAYLSGVLDGYMLGLKWARNTIKS